MPLTNKQQRFVSEYLVDLNATQAAIRAGYSSRTARSIGQENLTKPDIQAAIQAAMAQQQQRLEIEGDRVVREVARLALSDLRKLTTWGPSGVALRDSGTIDDDAAAAVAEVSQTTTQAGGTVRIKLHSKIQALELLGRHLGLWEGKALLDRVAALERLLNASQAGDDPGPAGGDPSGTAPAPAADSPPG